MHRRASSRPSGSKLVNVRVPRHLRVPKVELTDLCHKLHAAERTDAREVRPESIYERHQHFAYQWLRVKQFRRLLAGLRPLDSAHI